MQVARRCLLVVLFGLLPAMSTVAARGAEKDVPGWEAARWGMNEADVRKAFRSKRLVEPGRSENPNTKALNLPDYVFLGCPFDVTFYVERSRGLVRVELKQVEKPAGRPGGNSADYENACGRIEQKLEEKYGPGDVRRYEKDWTFRSAEITSGGAQTGQVYIDYRARSASKASP